VTHQRDAYLRTYFHLGTGLSDRIIASSEWARRSLPPRLRRRAAVVHDPVKLPPPAPSPVGRRPRIGVAGRGTPEKGHDLLVEAALAVADRFDFEVEVWGLEESGTGADFTRLVRKRVGTAAPAVQARFRFQPFRSDMDNFYTAVDVVVVPSRVAEGFGLTAAEAMAWGRPVVVAGHGGLQEIVTHEKTGLVFEPHDWRSLRDQLERLLTDVDLRCRLGLAGRAEVAARFSPSGQADLVEAVYRQALGTPGPVAFGR
jgi:glycosyltransferase involved in cell wall biosynthesis